MHDFGKPLTATSLDLSTADIVTTKEGAKVSAELPGIPALAINLSMPDSQTLSLSAKHGEREYWEQWRLPWRIKEAGIKAEYKDGLLEVHVPREDSHGVSGGKRIEVKSVISEAEPKKSVESGQDPMISQPSS